LLVASLGKFRANVRNAGQANVRRTPSARKENYEIDKEMRLHTTNAYFNSITRSHK